MEEMNIYKTTNFHIAVWLMMNSIPLKSVNWTSRRRAEFVFDEPENREALVNEFFQQEQLQSYISSSTELKARMYADNPPVEYER